jgi:formylglycine-generating enzyme required for sulfatase activity
MNKPKILNPLAAIALGLSLAASVAEASSITVDRVAQRWPWNNKIDITYTVSGGQDVAAGVFARIVFTANIGGNAYTIDGVHDVGASASDGTHTVAWTVPSGLRASGCTVTAVLLSADNPSGDDYMVVDLGTGTVSYEGLLASQAASNARYNTDTYKTTKFVLRKVPAWGARAALPNAAALNALSGYPTGMDDSNDGASSSAGLKNPRVYWNTVRDYYIGIFPITQDQYRRIYGSNPAPWTGTDPQGNPGANRPVNKVTWNELRVSTTSPVDPVPSVSSFSGTFLQRLNFRTGLSFDLPTEIMWEIAARAGATTTYPWGNDGSAATKRQYVCCYPDSHGNNSYNSTLAVGIKLPNGWGIYDMIGNVLEWCRDDSSLANLADATDPFVPAWASATKVIVRGGGNFGEGGDSTNLRPSRRVSTAPSVDQYAQYGFRVAFIVP